MDLYLRTWGKRCYLNVWDSQYPIYTKALLEHGYKIQIMEQMEYGSKKEDEILKREVTQIITQGTFVDDEIENYNSRFLMAIVESHSTQSFGLAIVDCTTHEF